MSGLKYTLSIQNRPLPPLTEGDRISLSPTKVVKLEPQRYIKVFTGVKISKCDPKGKIVITPHQKYADDLVFTENTYDITCRDELSVLITNHSYRFIRVESAEDLLFTFEWISDEVSKLKNPVEDIVEEVVNHVVDDVVSNVVDAAEEKTDDVVLDAAEEKTDDTSADVAEEKTDDVVPDAAEEKTEEVAEPKPAPKRRVQKKKRVSTK
jgi:hypothetical protein